MPSLNVTQVLASPYFADNTLVYFRYGQIMTVDGTAIVQMSTAKFSGVVTNDKGDRLSRSGTAARIEANITIHTKTRLQDGKTGVAADEVLWQGNRYTVDRLRDWSTYGPGFVACECELKPIDGGV